MIEINDKTKCMGCHACYNKCPVQAIEMVEDEMGFKYPRANKEKCINCGLCERVCPILNPTKIENKPKAYAVKNKDEEVRSKSSSGGMFTLLAESILEDGGVVFGVAFDENWKLKHTYMENVEGLQIFRGSKYLQSTIGDTYAKVKEFLHSGRKVMFTGTPCQIEGLKAYLGKENDNLFTQDIICHGVPSSKVHEKYLEYLKSKCKTEKIENIVHRTKIKGWKNWCVNVKFNNSEYIKSHNDDPYMQAFLKNTSLRESCYNCQFKKKHRVSDITLGDSWNSELPKEEQQRGISLVLCQTEKGKKLLEMSDLCLHSVDLDKAVSANHQLREPSTKPAAYKDIFEKLKKGNKFNRVIFRYLPLKCIKQNIKQLLLKMKCMRGEK